MVSYGWGCDAQRRKELAEDHIAIKGWASEYRQSALQPHVLTSLLHCRSAISRPPPLTHPNSGVTRHDKRKLSPHPTLLPPLGHQRTKEERCLGEENEVTKTRVREGGRKYGRWTLMGSKCSKFKSVCVSMSSAHGSLKLTSRNAKKF